VDTVDFSRFIFAFLFVMGLIGIMAYFLKRFGGVHKLNHKMFGMQDDSGRIKISEIRYLDPKRRLVLIRRDDVEHLLLLADNRELVIESDIKVTMMDAPKTPVLDSHE
jgi:flagellar protein FliO/FliZ